MNILPYQVHNLLKIYRKPSSGPERDGTGGRKEQIKRRILSEILGKIR